MPDVSYHCFRIMASYCPRKHHRAHRLLLAAAIRPGNSGNGYRDIGVTMLQCTLRHCPGDGDGNRPECFQNVLIYANRFHFGIVGIGDKASVNHI